jgi:2-hydroxy-3-keto-5-methylthiopentenyl-1-phosphate phosphatase
VALEDALTLISHDRYRKDYLVVSDFDQTLSFNDSGRILSERLGVTGFEERVAGLAHIHLVQQGGELGYLLLHDPEFRKARREDLIAVGRNIELKANIDQLIDLLAEIDGHRFRFYVASAAPEEVVRPALEGMVPPDRIFGTRFRYAANGEIEAILCMPAGYGKVAVLDEIRSS